MKTAMWLATVAAGLAACTVTTVKEAPPLCERTGRCPNAQPPSPVDARECEQSSAGACGKEYTALLQCLLDKEQCGPTGDRDTAATLTLCDARATAFASCRAQGSEDGGIDAGPPPPTSCSPKTCLGCCLAGICMPGTMWSACGSGGQACVACPGEKICGSDRTCGIDPESSWRVQPKSATISTKNQGADWDFGGGAPDPWVQVWCPANAALPTFTPTDSDTFSPTWSTGGCVAKAKDLLTIGFAIAVIDEDITIHDTIAPKGTIVLTEDKLLSGTQSLTNNSTLITMKVDFIKQ